MTLAYPSMVDFGLESAAAGLTRAFSDYLIPVVITPAALLQMARTDSVDLAASRVIVRAGAALGGALVARRGWTARLAAMAILPEARRTGVGRAAVVRLLAEAKGRGDRTMVLEVIEANAAAVALYVACGFKKIRRLIGYEGPGAISGDGPVGLVEVDLREMAGAVACYGLRNLPWQMSAETLAQLTPPSAAFHLNGAWVALSDPTGPVITIRGLITETPAHDQGRAAALVRAVMARFPAKTWRISALWPEELADAIDQTGLARSALSQLQMEIML